MKQFRERSNQCLRWWPNCHGYGNPCGFVIHHCSVQNALVFAIAHDLPHPIRKTNKFKPTFLFLLQGRNGLLHSKILNIFQIYPWRVRLINLQGTCDIIYQISYVNWFDSWCVIRVFKKLDNLKNWSTQSNPYNLDRVGLEYELGLGLSSDKWKFYELKFIINFKIYIFM